MCRVVSGMGSLRSRTVHWWGSWCRRYVYLEYGKGLGGFMRKEDFGRVSKFYDENLEKFETKRQASKYLNHYGKVWKEEHNIPLSDPKRR